MPANFPIGLQIYVYVASFLLGAVMGSFINCAADRYLCGKSVLEGRSFCPSCGHTLGILDLFPIFSFLFLRGKCRYCGAKIPARCLFTELAGGIAYLVIVLTQGLTFPALELAFLTPALFAVALIDADTMEIPNGLPIYVALLFIPFMLTYEDSLYRLIDGAIGAVVFGGGTLLIALIMDKVMKRETMGGGDIKLLAAVGLYTGLVKGLLMVILACIAGLVTALVLRNKNRQFPFGPSICAATLFALTAGQYVIDFYTSLFIPA